MLAKIRLYKDGSGQFLPRPVDLMRFNEEDIRQRLVDLGYDYHSDLMIVGFEDWQIERILTLEEAYRIRDLIKSAYSGNDFLVCHMLGNHSFSIESILTNRYAFLSKDEEEAMVEVSKYYDADTLIRIFRKTNTWVNFIVAFVSSGELLNTSQGFYFKVN